MSCCGQERNALNQRKAPGQHKTPGEPRGQRESLLAAALLAFLARKAVSTGKAPPVSRRRSR
jgi:hypothetical protein